MFLFIGLIYVVDSSDRERIAESREELFGILDSDETREVPVVVIANKQDLPSKYTYNYFNIKNIYTKLKKPNTFWWTIFIWKRFWTYIYMYQVSRYNSWEIICWNIDCYFFKKFIIADALKPSEVADLMTLRKLTSRKWFIQAACATTGEGIFEAMSEMANMVKEYQAKSHWAFTD